MLSLVAKKMVGAISGFSLIFHAFFMLLTFLVGLVGLPTAFRNPNALPDDFVGYLSSLFKEHIGYAFSLRKRIADVSVSPIYCYDK